MKTKYIALLLTVIMLFSMIPFSYAYPGDDAFLDFGNKVTEEQEADVLCKLLVRLKMLSYDTSNFIQNEIADYSDFIFALAAMENIDTSLSIGELYDELKKRDLVTEDKMPKTLLLKDVIYSSVRLTGLWDFAEKKGGYSEDYMNVAFNKKLLYNVRIEKEAPLTKGELVQLLYNMLAIPSYIESGIQGENTIFKIGCPETLLERRFDVTMVKGVVTANGVSSLYGRSGLEDDETEINRETYYNEENNLRIYLGKSIVAFVQKAENDKQGTILCTELSKRNSVKMINAQSLVDAAGNTISYLDGEINRKINIPSDAIILYNGVSKGSIESVNLENLTDKCTSIEAIDNDDDDKIDVLSIWKYEHFAVSAIAKNVVFLKYGMKFNGAGQVKLIHEGDDDFRVEAYKNGISITKTTELSVNDIISVAISDNEYGKKLIIVQACDKIVTGTISSISNEDYGYSIETSGGEFGQNTAYPVTHDFAKVSGLDGSGVTDPDVTTPKLGSDVVLAFTCEGYVADARKAVENENYGYIIQVVKSKGLNPVGIIKFIDASGNIHVCNFAKKVKCHNEENPEGERISGTACADIIVAQGGEDGDYRSIIIYLLNNENEISEIYLPYDNRGKAPGNVGYPLTFDFSAISSDTGRPSIYYFGFFDNYRYFAEKDNSLFVIPDWKDADNEKLYKVVSQAYFGTHYQYPNIELYGCDRFYQSKIGVTRAKVTQTPYIGGVPAIVSGIIYVSDPETGDMMNLRLVQDGMLKTVPLNEDDIVSVGGFTEGISISDLKKGDIIQYDTSQEGKLNTFRFMLRPTVENDFKTEKGGSDSLYGTYAKVAGVKGDFILADTIFYGGEESGTYMYRLGNPNAVRKFGASVFYKGSGTIESASASDLIIGDTVYLTSNYGFVTNMFIIRD